MNIELLEKVKAAILAEPESYDQNTFGSESPGSPCGTVACIAGHALVQAGQVEPEELAMLCRRDVGRSIEGAARYLLNLTEEQSSRLFNPSSFWPEPYATQMDRARSQGKRAEVARIAATRIEKFIETNGAV